ncbi:hypothetical protein VCHA50P416_90164 [Vibrio chagasii]|nr:hypothetical protein VCHA43P272_100015 [Vibrio chagasii]CAH7392860.1 hypothetical protein VCHA42P256_90164 [Vibrio chagasii]CAH7483146.1 hypothetical protein VCHA50P416_90164 [Vibrio chagasii]
MFTCPLAILLCLSISFDLSLV